MNAIRLPATAAALVAGIGFSGLAAAQTKVWNFGDVTVNGACTGNHNVVGNTINCTQQPGGTVVDLKLNAFSALNTAGSTYATAAVNYHGTGSGVGVRNVNDGTGSPDHSMDNNGSSDMLLLSFTGAQVLKTVTLGWAYTDSDFQLLRWTGGAFVAPTGQTASALLGAVGSGWDLVSTVNGGSTGSTDTAYNVNPGNASSSYWLISAFNSAFGGSGSAGVDGMKVLGVSAAANGVAEPGSLALAALALAGATGLRRRRARRAD